MLLERNLNIVSTLSDIVCNPGNITVITLTVFNIDQMYRYIIHVVVDKQ